MIVMDDGARVTKRGLSCRCFLWQKVSFPRASLTHDVVMPMHQTSIDSLEDMASLGDLHEGAILYNIYQRYQRDKIYVSWAAREHNAMHVALSSASHGVA